ncbi:EamA family transporter [Demequina pelophila]|uniref:EamA family transporter n=1 Tax=Demequina pelophila TaxID=1638984 RepID=UPI000785B0E8|nr:EamA family transporter [Demequina pelophila]
MARPGAGLTRGLGSGGAVSLVVAGAFTQQFGAALAVLLFPRAGPGGIVFLRLAFSAILLLAVLRPRIRGLQRADWLTVAGFAACLAAMNITIYQAIARIPLGAAVTIEMLGPLVLAIITGRRLVSWIAAGIALAGVVLMSGGGFESLDPWGVAFALAAAACWAGYILMSAATGRRFRRHDGLAIAMALGAVAALPLGIASAGTALLDPATLALGAAVAVLSSAIPYVLEMAALRRIRPATFAILMSLMPAIASIAGFVALGQRLSWQALVGIALVIGASALAVRAGRAPRPVPDAAPA